MLFDPSKSSDEGAGAIASANARVRRVLRPEDRVASAARAGSLVDSALPPPPHAVVRKTVEMREARSIFRC